MCSLFINPLITIGSNFINCIWSWKEWIWECIISSDWIYYHRCNEQGVQKNNISQTGGFCWNVNVYDQPGNLFSCLAPALFIFVRCLQKGGKHTWDPGKVDRQYFIQTMSHLSHPAAWSWSQSGRWGMYHGHSLTAASSNKNVNVCKRTKADCHCWDPVACLCILFPPWLYVSDLQNELSAVHWCIQLMTGSVPWYGGSK